MSREVLYRKWRPRTFAELAGQEAVTRTLTNAIGAGKVSHAYLLSGPRGTGKTTTGRLLAKAVNCANPKDGEPCNKCERCIAFLENRVAHLDWLVELDGASNRGIDDIRDLRSKAFTPPIGDTTDYPLYKVYLVDEVHMLTEPAFNALLKTLEEPPAHVIFVLATTEAHKVPATVASRCQRFDFRRIPLAAAVERLAHICKEEGISCAQDGLEAIARIATGSMRDSINLLEQLVDSYGKTLTLEQVREGLGLVVDPRSVELAAHVLRGELAEGLSVIASVRDDGLDLRQFQRQVVTYTRALLLTKAGAPPSDSWSAEQLAEMRALVENVPAERIVRSLHALGEADLRADPLSPLPLELAIATTVLGPAPTSAAVAPAARAPVAQPAPVPPPPAPRPAAKAPAPREQPAAKEEPKAAGPKDEPKAAAPKEEPPPNPGTPARAASENGREASPELDAVRERWQEIYQRARELHFRVGALLNSGCAIIQASDGEIVFGFRHEWLLQKMHENGGESQRALQQAVDEVLGPGHKVRCVHEPDVDTQRPPRGGHLVRAVEALSEN